MNFFKHWWKPLLLLVIILFFLGIGAYCIAHIPDRYGPVHTLTTDLNSITIKTNLTRHVREVNVPFFHMTFNVPLGVSTGLELHSSIHDENRAQTTIRLYKNDTKYSKDPNGWDVANNTIIFSFDFPYGNDITFGPDEFLSYFPESPSHTLLTNKLSFRDSILQPNAVNFYTYFDREHLRFQNKPSIFFKGKVRMDVVEESGKHSTIGIVFGCYDQSSPNTTLCQETFQMFLDSLRLHQGTLQPVSINN